MLIALIAVVAGLVLLVWSAGPILPHKPESGFHMTMLAFWRSG